MPIPINAIASSASMPATTASAPAVTIGGMAASRMDTPTTVPFRFASRQMSNAVRGAIISLIAKPTPSGAITRRGRRRRSCIPMAVITSGTGVRETLCGDSASFSG